MVLAIIALVARYLPIPGHLWLYLVVVSPYLIPAAPIALVILLWGRRWIHAVFAGCLCTTLIAIQIPWYVATTPKSDSVPVRTMSMNMEYGQADPRSVADIAGAQADVLMVQELTPEAVKSLSAAGLDQSFPYRALEARPEAGGVGVYSRYPITRVDRIGGFENALVSAQIHVDGVPHATSVAAVHFAAPWPQSIDAWRSDFASFPKFLAELAEESGAGSVIVGGDYNSTVDMRPFRNLLANGYHDAADQAGSGRNLTYPADSWIPPFMGIDHFLTRNAIAVSTKTARVPGTDHRGLLGMVMVPKA